MRTLDAVCKRLERLGAHCRNSLACKETGHWVDVAAEVRLAFTNLVRIDSTNMRVDWLSESQIHGVR